MNNQGTGNILSKYRDTTVSPQIQMQIVQTTLKNCMEWYRKGAFRPKLKFIKDEPIILS
jgi:hypothetical protein